MRNSLRRSRGSSEHNVEIRARDRQRYAGQPRPAADVDHPLPRFEEFGDGGAIEEVAVPEALDLAWPDQAARHARVRERVRVSAGDVEAVPNTLAAASGAGPAPALPGGAAPTGSTCFT